MNKIGCQKEKEQNSFPSQNAVRLISDYTCRNIVLNEAPKEDSLQLEDDFFLINCGIIIITSLLTIENVWLLTGLHLISGLQILFNKCLIFPEMSGKSKMFLNTKLILRLLYLRLYFLVLGIYFLLLYFYVTFIEGFLGVF